MARRSRLRRPLKRAKKRLLRHALWAAALALLALFAVNSAVRAAGGAVSRLSVRRVGERAHAVSLLTAHALTCRTQPGQAEQAVREAALRHGISRRLALAIARTESDMVHTRISSTGAMGLMQLMPGTARELGVSDPFDVREGADGGVRYLKQLLTTYRGNVRRAVAAYNAGPGRVPQRGPLLALPLETKSYVTRVVSRM